MPNLQFQKVHTSLDELLDVGLRDKNGYVITQVGYELYNDHIIGYYEATKNHNRLSEFMGIVWKFQRTTKFMKDTIIMKNLLL